MTGTATSTSTPSSEQPHRRDLRAERARPHHEDEQWQRRHLRPQISYGPVYPFAKQGPPPQTRTTPPPSFRNSDFCTRARGSLRGWLCGSSPARFGWLTSGGGGVPESHITRAEPSNG